MSVGSLAALPTLTPGAGALLGVITKQAIRLRDLQIGRPPHSEDQRLHRHLEQRLQAVCLDLRRPEQLLAKVEFVESLVHAEMEAVFLRPC